MRSNFVGESQSVRSRNMSMIKSANTSPEKTVRSVLHKLGFRFRLHRKDLPGTPDIVMPKYKMIIMVHGCFWHQHANCPRSHKPKSNKGYWLPKLKRNIERDKKAKMDLESKGWKVLIIWECETYDIDKLAIKLKDYLLI